MAAIISFSSLDTIAKQSEKEKIKFCLHICRRFVLLNQQINAMKVKVLFIISVFISCVAISCRHIRVVSLTTDDVVSKSDSVQIYYDFWRENGKATIKVVNNRNAPLYIDLKKSVFYVNSNGREYWQNRATIISTGINYVRYGNGGFFGGNISSGSISFPERVIFMSPHSSITFNWYNLPMPKGNMYLEEEMDTLTYKFQKMNVALYQRGESPITIENYFTFSLTEDFKTEFSISNHWWAHKIITFKKSARYKEEQSYFYEPLSYYYFLKTSDGDAPVDRDALPMGF